MSNKPTLSYGLANVLKTQLLLRQEANSKYSLRAFARDIQVSPSTISKIMNEKYVISDKMLNEIVDYLNLDLALKQKVIFFERCRKLGEFLSVTRAQRFSDEVVKFQKTIKVDSNILKDVMRIIESINEGFLNGVETVSRTPDSELHYDMSIVVEFSQNQ